MNCAYASRVLMTAAGLAMAASVHAGTNPPCPSPQWLPVHIEETFVGQSVNCVIEWDDGTGPALYIGGEFSSMNGSTSFSLVKYDGVRYTAVGGGVHEGNFSSLPGKIYCMTAWDPDGAGPQKSMLVIGGEFTHGGIAGVNGILSSNVVAWDGTNWISLGVDLGEVDIGETPQVRDLVVFDSGSGPQLYACGQFKLLDGRKNIARWNGSLWTSIGTPVSTSGLIYDMHIHNDGSGNKLYVSGTSPSLQPMAGHPTLARWTGSAWEGVGAGPYADIVSRGFETFDADGPGGQPAKLCVGGRHTGTNDIFLSTWNGSAWTNTVVPVEPDEIDSLYDAISDLQVHNDGSGNSLYIALSTAYIVEPGADLHTYGVKKWNGTTFSNENSTRTDYGPSAFAAGADRYLYSTNFGGSPQLWLGQPSDQNDMQRGATLVKNGSTWGPTIAPQGTAGTAMDAVMWDSDGAGPAKPALYCAGQFSGGAIAATFDGVEFQPLPALPGCGSGCDRTGLACTIYNDGGGEAFYVAVTSNITNVLAGTPTTVYKLVGSSWVALGGDGAFVKPNSGNNTARVYDLTVFNDGSGAKLYAAGRFTTAGGVTCNNIARWSGTAWQAVGPAATPGLYASLSIAEPYTEIFSAIPHNDGSGMALYVNGRFQHAGGTPANFIARWNGTNWSPVGTPLPGYIASVNSLVEHDDGVTKTLYAGGYDVEYSLTETSRIYKWNGASWIEASAGFNSNNHNVYLVGSFDNGTGRKLYALGADYSQSVYGQQYYTYSGGTWSAVPDSFAGDVYNVPRGFEFNTAKGSGALMLTGWSFGGVLAPGLAVNAINGSRSSMAVWGCQSPACAADFNGDSARDVADLFAYINAWLAKTSNADFNNSGNVDVADLFAYINAWLAGC